jgi:glycosyltransferase involved in cell wall biosynthesis
MVILHIVSNLTTGGAELMLKRLAAHHAGDDRFTHAVVSLREKATVGPQLEALGVSVEALGLAGARGMPRVLGQLRQRIRGVNPDIVQTWMYHADLLGGIAARLAGVRHIIWGVRTTDIALAGVPRSTLLTRRICARLSRTVPERILYVGEAARSVHERLGYDPGKAVVIQNGYSVPALAAVAAARAARRAELNLDAGAVLVGAAGRFSAEKGYDMFIAAAERIAARHGQARFVLIGRDVTWDNPELVRWIRASGLEDRFVLLGEQRRIHEWLAAVDVFVLSSLYEGFPNIVAEAMSVCTPCVVTDVGDAALLIGDSGILVPAGDLDGLARGVSTMIEEGEDARRSRGGAARTRVEDRFSIEAIARRYEDLYLATVSRTDA